MSTVHPYEETSEKQMRDYSEQKKALESNIAQLTRAIDLCFAERLVVPALLLTYCGIDAMGFVDSPRSGNQRSRERFEEWARKYVLKNMPKPTCNEGDLWGARCGLVHSHISESDHKKNRKAREVFYSCGDHKSQELSILLDEGKVAVQVDDLIDAFKIGVGQFLSTIERHPLKAKLAYERANKMYSNIPFPAQARERLQDKSQNEQAPIHGEWQ